MSKQADEQQQQQAEDNDDIKCSAIHALERDMSHHDYSHLVRELRRLILEDNQLNLGLYDQRDMDTCRDDDWQLARFLLGHKLDLGAAFNMLRASLRFKNESLYAHMRPDEFPREFYQHAGAFSYEPDRKNNVTFYMRANNHRRVRPELRGLLNAYLDFQMMQCDQKAKGGCMCVIIDCTGAGVECIDSEMLQYRVWTLSNFFPWGLSYLLVHNLPLLLRPLFRLITKVWLAPEYCQLIRFSNSKTIFEYVTRQNVPDFMGGTCKRDYRQVPAGCESLIDMGKLWGFDLPATLEILESFKHTMPGETLERARALVARKVNQEVEI